MAAGAILRRPTALGTMYGVDERDVTIVMETLFDIRARVIDIHDFLIDEDDEDDGTPEEEEDT